MKANAEKVKFARSIQNIFLIPKTRKEKKKKSFTCNTI